MSSSHHKSVKSHIGTKEPITAICVYSLPNDIENSVKNVRLEGFTHRNENDGKEFFKLLNTIKLIGIKKFSVSNCRFFDFWGDAVSMSHYGDTPDTGERTRNSDVTIKDNYIDGGNHNNRNGVSVISGEHVVVENNIFVETSRYNMHGSIDIELTTLPI